MKPIFKSVKSYIKGIKITNVDGNQVMTWLENGEPQKQILGKAPSEKGEDLTETELEHLKTAIAEADFDGWVGHHSFEIKLYRFLYSNRWLCNFVIFFIEES